jgi:hypothetical protein
MRLDALEVGEIEAQVSIENALEEQGKSLRAYRFLLTAKRRQLVRDRMLTLMDAVDESDLDTEGFIRLVSRPLLGVTLRGYSAPCGSALFCFGYAALWVTVSSFAGPSANAELGTWEPGPLARLRQV